MLGEIWKTNYYTITIQYNTIHLIQFIIKYNCITEIQYRKELKEAIRNNKVSYAMNIVKRQFEIHAPNHLLITTSVKPNDTSDNKNTKKWQIYEDDDNNLWRNL